MCVASCWIPTMFSPSAPKDAQCLTMSTKQESTHMNKWWSPINYEGPLTKSTKMPNTNTSNQKQADKSCQPPHWAIVLELFLNLPLILYHPSPPSPFIEHLYTIVLHSLNLVVWDAWELINWHIIGTQCIGLNIGIGWAEHTHYVELVHCIMLYTFWTRFKLVRSLEWQSIARISK